MLERVLGIILPVFLIIALGFGYARRAKPDMTWVNRINVNVLAPALIFTALAGKDFDLAANRLLIVGCIGVVLGSGPARLAVRQAAAGRPPDAGAPIMFNNCGNMGLPLAALAFGQAGLSAMVAIFTISNLLHFTVGIWIIDHHAKFWTMLRADGRRDLRRVRVRHRPAADARMLMLALKLTGDANDPADADLARRAAGRGVLVELAAGVIGGLVCPLTGIAMAALLSPSWARPAAAGLLLLFGCLPPAVLNFMVAEQYNQEPGKVASIVLIGNLMAVLFVPLGVSFALRS